MLERNPELEFSDKVDLDGLVKEAFADFQRDRSHFEGTEKQVELITSKLTPSHLLYTRAYLYNLTFIPLIFNVNSFCLHQDGMEAFYNTPPTGKRGTSSYLTKAVMIQLLQGDVKPCKDDPCSVS